VKPLDRCLQALAVAHLAALQLGMCSTSALQLDDVILGSQLSGIAFASTSGDSTAPAEFAGDARTMFSAVGIDIDAGGTCAVATPDTGVGGGAFGRSVRLRGLHQRVHLAVSLQGKLGGCCSEGSVCRDTDCRRRVHSVP
jgi:large exoprotein involved in heme utilization and adhesion